MIIFRGRSALRLLHSQSEKEKSDIHVLPADTYIVREVQKEVVTVHANAQHNRLRQKVVKKSDCHKLRSECRQLSPVSPNSLALQNIQRC